MPSFADFATAASFRDLVRAVVRTELEAERPGYTYATVTGIDTARRKCSVRFPGETASVEVGMGAIQPQAIGQVVRVDGRRGDRHIVDVLGYNDRTIKTLGTYWASFGDSHTTGQGGSPTFSGRRENSWFDHYMAHKTGDKGVIWAGALGLGGTDTAWGVRNLPAALAARPWLDTLFLGHGYNDPLASISLEQTIINMNLMVDMCFAANVVPVILDVVPSGSFQTQPQADARRVIGMAYRKLAQRRRLPFMRYASVVTNGATGRLGPPYNEDGVHMTPAGVKRVADFARYQLDNYPTIGTAAVASSPVDPSNLVEGGTFQSIQTTVDRRPPEHWVAAWFGITEASLVTSLVTPAASEHVVGNWFQVQLTNIQGTIDYVYNVPATKFGPGDVVELTGRLRITSAFTADMVLTISLVFPLVFQIGTNVVHWKNLTDGRFSTIGVVPANVGVSSALQVRFRIGQKEDLPVPMPVASGTYAIADVMLRNLTREANA